MPLSPARVRVCRTDHVSLRAAVPTRGGVVRARGRGRPRQVRATHPNRTSWDMSRTHIFAARPASDMMSVREVLGMVLSKIACLDSEMVALREAAYRVAAEDVLAPIGFPPFPASIMDGYAVIAADGPGEYPVAGQVLAGHPAGYVQKPGQVSYITTGAPIPRGADAVVRIEDTEPSGDRVRIKVGVKSGHDVREAGSDMAAGTLVIRAGSVLGPAELGLAATAGAGTVAVTRRPRVSVLSTGDELQPPGELLGPGQIPDSNHVMLSAMVQRMGCDVRPRTAIAEDTESQLRQEVRKSLGQSDLIITSGGISMGEADLLPKVLKDCGAEIHCERVLMKPGKPFTFSSWQTASGDRRCVVCSLPGNPASAMVTFLLFCVPALRRMLGHQPPTLPRIQVVLGSELVPDSTRPEFHRVALAWDDDLHDGRGGYRAMSTGSQRSSRLLSMLDADALVTVPPGSQLLPPDSTVSAIDLRHL